VDLLVTCHNITLHHNPEGLHLKHHHHESLNSCIMLLVSSSPRSCLPTKLEPIETTALMVRDNSLSKQRGSYIKKYTSLLTPQLDMPTQPQL